MSKDQSSVSELLPRLETSDLQELEHVKSSINDQLNTDRGGVLLSSLVDYYLDSSSPQAVALLSSIREPHDKPLLDKLNDCLSKPGSRLHTLVLLGHVVCKQPPWLHKISRSPLLSSLLKCLKADGDVVVLITGALVLITLLPIIPQAGKQHIYDFFDVFGRLASWGLRNPGHVHGVYLVHLHASVYSLFHRLYGMYPCNFISYLRLHYSMKENLATFEEVVKPMLEHVRVHPELVTGTQDYELDPSRWKCCEIHDIVIECSKMSLDPKECSSEEGYSSLPDPLYSSHMNLSSTGSSSCTPVAADQAPVSLSLERLSGNSSYIQHCEGDAITWSPSSVCGLVTPPASPATVLEPSGCFTQPPIIRTTSMSGVKCPSSATTPVTLSPATPLAEEHSQPSDNNNQPKQQPMEIPAGQPIKEEKEGGRSLSLTEVSDFIRERDLDHTTGQKEREDDAITAELLNLTVHASTPSRGEASLGTAQQPMPWSFRPCFTPIQALATGQPGGTDGGIHSPYRLEEGGPALFWAPSPHQGPIPPYEPLFQLALPRAASLFVDRKTQEVIQRAGKAGSDGEKDVKEEGEKESSLSPLDVLDHLITHGNDTHQRLSRKLSVDWSQIGGKQQSMRVKGSAQGEEVQTLRSQLLLVHSQLQYERYKRQQHAMRNRRLLRRVINATALQEHNDSMKGQLKLQEVEIESLRASLCEEQKRYSQLKHDTRTHTAQLHTQIQQLQQQQQEYYNKTQHLQSELEECQSRLGDLEAELQRANNEAYNAEHQLTQLSVKVSSSEQLEQHMFLLNKQLLLLGETNKLLQSTHTGDTEHNQEVNMVQSSVSKETLRLRDSAAQQTQRLEAANHRITELEAQLARKEQLILEQKKLLEDNKAHSSGQLSACEGRYVALKRVTQVLQTEMLQLYSQIDLDAHTYARSHTHTQPQEAASPPEGSNTSRSNGNDVVIPTSQSNCSIGNKPSASFSILNGGVEAILSSPLHSFSTSPLHPLSTSPLNLLSTSPIDAPLAVGSYPMEGSFLDQRARELFRPPPHGQEEKEVQRERRDEQEAKGQEFHLPPGSSLPQDTPLRDALPTDTPPRQNLSRDTLPRETLPGDALARDALAGDTLPRDAIPPASVPAVQRAPSLTEAVRQRRYELSIMDYNETLPE